MLPVRQGTPIGDDADDLVWVSEALAGDPAAFRMLFERHAPRVWRFLRDVSRDPAFADEATQETFVRAHSRLATLRDDQRLRPWLLGIARRVFLEELRRRKPRIAVDRGDRHDDTAVDLSGDAVRAPSPETELLAAEQTELFRRALAQLDPERRSVLLLRIDHELAYDEIAAVMGLSPAQVRNELHRGRQELRGYLAPYFAEPRKEGKR